MERRQPMRWWCSAKTGRMLGLGLQDGDGGLKPKVVFEARG